MAAGAASGRPPVRSAFADRTRSRPRGRWRPGSAPGRRSTSSGRAGLCRCRHRPGRGRARAERAGCCPSLDAFGSRRSRTPRPGRDCEAPPRYCAVLGASSAPAPSVAERLCLLGEFGPAAAGGRPGRARSRECGALISGLVPGARRAARRASARSARTEQGATAAPWPPTSPASGPRGGRAARRARRAARPEGVGVAVCEGRAMVVAVAPGPRSGGRRASRAAAGGRSRGARGGRPQAGRLALAAQPPALGGDGSRRMLVVRAPWLLRRVPLPGRERGKRGGVDDALASSCATGLPLAEEEIAALVAALAGDARRLGDPGAEHACRSSGRGEDRGLALCRRTGDAI